MDYNGLRRWIHRRVVDYMTTPDGYKYHWKQPMGLDAVYQHFMRSRRMERLQERHVIASKVPVISIGNVTFGGTGKTPFVMYLLKLLKDASNQQSPILLTRGYGDDEWRMLHDKYPYANISVGSDRLTTGRKAVEQYHHQVNCILLDDGLQQWHIHKDLEVIMIDAMHPFGNGRLLPCGSLREEPSVALERADIILLHHAYHPSDALSETTEIAQFQSFLDTIPGCKAIVATSRMKLVALPTALALQRRQPIDKSSYCSALIEQMQGKAALILCGVGNPESVQLAVEGMGCWSTVEMEVYPDHHAFTATDLASVRDQATQIANRLCVPVVILTTEKDFYRSGEIMTNIFASAFDFRILQSELEVGYHQDAVSKKIVSLVKA